MADKNIPPKIYRKLLKNNYNETHKRYLKIKNFQTKKSNPICQKEDRYVPPRTRANYLTQQYIKRVSEKPERPHIKKVPVKRNLASGLTVIAEPRQVRAIKIGPIQKNHPYSAERRVVRKKMFPESNKNFYYDAFNSRKEIQSDLIKDIKKRVSYYFLIILAKICM